MALALTLAGCASHSDYTKDARTALDQGRTKDALAQYNEALDVESAKDLPEKIGGDNVLFILDRAVVLQALKEDKLSSRDLEIADKQIEVLDFSRSSVADIGKYMFSDDTGPYKAPSYEKLMINTLNMVNYLVRRDLNGARIEARRFSVMQRHLKDSKGTREALNVPGSYLAGFAFEKSKQVDEALRYYDEALVNGELRSLDDTIVRLAAQSSYRSPRITAVLERRATALTAPATAPAATTAVPAVDPAKVVPTEPAEVLVVINYGRVPAKVARRIPIGLALTYASGAISPYDQGRANRLAAQGLVTWVNYPELGEPRGTWSSPLLRVDGQSRSLDPAIAIDQEAKRAWSEVRGSVVASAITRMITRIVAGEAVNRASGGDTIGILLSLATQATLTATDTPDTRSWSTLPARMALGRLSVAPGVHWIELEARGRRERYKIDVKPGDWVVLNLTVLR
jgi:tetratricopeptide (TPR) repeat protein